MSKQRCNGPRTETQVAEYFHSLLQDVEAAGQYVEIGAGEVPAPIFLSYAEAGLEGVGVVIRFKNGEEFHLAAQRATGEQRVENSAFVAAYPHPADLVGDFGIAATDLHRPERNVA